MLDKFILVCFIIFIILIIYNVRIFGVDFFVTKTYELRDLTGYQSDGY